MNTYEHSVSLDVSRSTGCTMCLKRCPTEAIRITNGHAVINPDRCIDCGVCQTVAGEAILEDTEASEEDVNFNAENADKWEVVE